MKVNRVPIGSLHPDPSNPRTHDERNLESIEASLRQFGQAEPLVVQQGTGRVIGGNGRLVVMRKLGWAECDVVELEVDDLSATALSIALNRSAELAGWENDTLGSLLAVLRDSEFDHLVTGFTDDEIEAILNLGGIACEEDEIPDPPDEATTNPGDIWILGEHRVLCGDSSKAEDVDRLLGGQAIQLVNTDPPYNVKVEPRSNNAIAAGLSSFEGVKKNQKLDLMRGTAKPRAKGKMRAKDRPLENDFISDEDFERLLLAWFGNLARVLEPGRSFYIWGGYANVANYPRPLAECGLYFSQCLIWHKQHPVLTRKDFMGDHEWCFYGWKSGAAHRWFGPNNVADVWAVKKVPSQKMVHLTEKPVELAVRAMTYSSRRGENVLDLFGGSGSTLIAAEQAGRRAFLMEIDPLYCDVIVMRWENFTGGKAERGAP